MAEEKEKQEVDEKKDIGRREGYSTSTDWDGVYTTSWGEMRSDRRRWG